MTNPAPSMFSPTIPNFPIYWDSTMLGLLKECPRKFQYQIIDGFQPKGLSIHLRFGLLYHGGIEQYEHAKARGEDHEAAIRTMLRWTLEQSGERDENGVFIPWESGDSYKNRYTLIRSLIWHAEEYRDSNFETVILHDGKPAVELTFNFPAFEVEGETISLCGHLDLLKRQKGTKYVWVVDHKTTKSALNEQFYKSFTPHNQFTLYTIAGKVVLNDNCQGVLVSAAEIQVGSTRFGQRPIPRPAAVLDEWLHDTQSYVAQARHYALSNYWPMNDKSCTAYGGCPFRTVCAVSPSHRPAWLKQDFMPFHWDPLIARGDV